MRKNQRGPLHLGNDVRHGKGLAGAGHAQQRLLLIAPFEPLHQLSDGLGLIASGVVGRGKLESFRIGRFDLCVYRLLIEDGFLHNNPVCKIQTKSIAGGPSI